ncbi:hypothetical protein CYD53_101587 [Bosea psychrotolerans]|uniref:Uncharacterized protein n=1 Tax=Bosea psychrotolerans TaxID=1871628 RepID=A0A2S4MQP0_9HYPH|nr:hypothetical protein CYD53_101587 [Bosea psychrotolerans]
MSAMAPARADIDPSVVLPRDRLLERGDSSHHLGKIAS